MAILPSKEENGKMVLDIYAHFKTRPGDVLRANNFIAVAARNHVRMDDLQKGLDYAAAMGWIEETDNGSLRLTQEGYRLMQ